MRGLIHLHTQFSDGWGTVEQAAEIARACGFDRLIVTDHLRNLKLKTGRTLQEYVAACERASARAGIAVIPGGEIEVAWEQPGVDRSEAHTPPSSLLAEEQLTHATHVHLGDRPCQEKAIVEALACGRTCVTQGSAEFACLLPVPDLQRRYPGPARLQLELPRT